MDIPDTSPLPKANEATNTFLLPCPNCGTQGEIKSMQVMLLEFGDKKTTADFETEIIGIKLKFNYTFNPYRRYLNKGDHPFLTPLYYMLCSTFAIIGFIDAILAVICIIFTAISFVKHQPWLPWYLYLSIPGAYIFIRTAYKGYSNTAIHGDKYLDRFEELSTSPVCSRCNYIVRRPQ